jgi:hypothetical protein
MQSLVAGLSQQKPGFDSRPVHVKFVVDKVSVGQVLFRELRFCPVTVIVPMIRSCYNLNIALTWRTNSRSRETFQKQCCFGNRRECHAKLIQPFAALRAVYSLCGFPYCRRSSRVSMRLASRAASLLQICGRGYLYCSSTGDFQSLRSIWSARYWSNFLQVFLYSVLSSVWAW